MSLGRVQSRGRWRCRPVRFQKAQTWCWPDMAGTAQNGSKFEVVMVREKVIFGQRLWYHLFTISLCAILFCNSDMFGSYCAILFGWLPDHHGSTMIISIPNGLCTPLPKTFFSPLSSEVQAFPYLMYRRRSIRWKFGNMEWLVIGSHPPFLRNSQSGSRFTPVHPWF